jgi:hypothetical protein
MFIAERGRYKLIQLYGAFDTACVDTLGLRE